MLGGGKRTFGYRPNVRSVGLSYHFPKVAAHEFELRNKLFDGCEYFAGFGGSANLQREQAIDSYIAIKCCVNIPAI